MTFWVVVVLTVLLIGVTLEWIHIIVTQTRQTAINTLAICQKLAGIADYTDKLDEIIDKLDYIATVIDTGKDSP